MVRGYGLVLIAAGLWATLGLWYRVLIDEYHLARLSVVAYRAGIAALVLLVGLGVYRPRLLHIRRRDWLFFVGFGVVGVAGFYGAYIAAISNGSLAQAAVLLYTAPFWITLWGVVREHEALDGRKFGALGLAFAGCVLVAGAYNPTLLAGNRRALLWGLASGLGYAIYSICSGLGTRRGYAAWTVVGYSLGVGAVGLFALAPLHDTLHIIRTPAAWPFIIGMALLPTLLGPLCFTWGLATLHTSNASIMATFEPVIAAALAWMLLHEPLTLPQLAGGVLVLGAVVVLLTARRAAQSSTAHASEERV